MGYSKHRALSAKGGGFVYSKLRALSHKGRGSWVSFYNLPVVDGTLFVLQRTGVLVIIIAVIL